jgi:hypothetical protein
VGLACFPSFTIWWQVELVLCVWGVFCLRVEPKELKKNQLSKEETCKDKKFCLTHTVFLSSRFFSFLFFSFLFISFHFISLLLSLSPLSGWEESSGAHKSKSETNRA